jgi:hypothetical protein
MALNECLGRKQINVSKKYFKKTKMRYSVKANKGIAGFLAKRITSMADKVVDKKSKESKEINTKLESINEIGDEDEYNINDDNVDDDEDVIVVHNPNDLVNHKDPNSFVKLRSLHLYDIIGKKPAKLVKGFFAFFS